MNLSQHKHTVFEFGLGNSDYTVLIIKNEVLYIQI